MIDGDLTLGSGASSTSASASATSLVLDVDGRMTFGGLLTVSFLDGFSASACTT